MEVEPNVVIGEFITNSEDHLYKKENTGVDIEAKASMQAESLSAYNVPFYILTNEDSKECDNGLHILKTKLPDYFNDLSLYINRVIMAFNFLLEHPEIEKAALTDVTDVKMLNYPFDKIKDDFLYIGDEIAFISINQTLTYNNSADYVKKFIWENGHLQVLNPGVIIGTRAVLLEFLGIMVDSIIRSEVDRKKGKTDPGPGVFEMALTNYVAYSFFGDRLIHGKEVSTIFHGEQEISSAWFKHK